MTIVNLIEDLLGLGGEIEAAFGEGARQICDAAAAVVLADRARNAALVSEAVADVTAERRRQIKTEGWTPEHDDQHTDGALAMAATCYASRFPLAASYWPWDLKWWKPKDRRSNLIRAGALILAEIERLDRLTAAHPHKRSRRTTMASDLIKRLEARLQVHPRAAAVPVDTVDIRAVIDVVATLQADHDAVRREALEEMREATIDLIAGWSTEVGYSGAVKASVEAMLFDRDANMINAIAALIPASQPDGEGQDRG